LDAVEFVAVARAVFGGPEFSGDGVKREALGMAVAIAPDAGPRAAGFHERIVGRRGTVGVDAMDFSERTREILGAGGRATFTDREEEVAVLVPEKAAAIVARVGEVIFLRRAEDQFFVGPRAVANASAHDDGHAGGGIFAGLGVGEVEPAVLRVVGMGDEIE